MSQADADKLNDTMLQGLARGDAAQIASVYAPDARLLPPGLDVQTGDDIQRYWQGAVDAGLRYGHIETISYEEHGDVAIEEGRWELRAAADSPVVDAGKFLIVHRRQPDGTWKYALDMFQLQLGTCLRMTTGRSNLPGRCEPPVPGLLPLQHPRLRRLPPDRWPSNRGCRAAIRGRRRAASRSAPRRPNRLQRQNAQ
ncbi:MAG: nuclear transport factor 2 family protein [Actinomycetota bacterium]|nr:nuclear transport factor 2 family protein [Actinomycetota bacterium]